MRAGESETDLCDSRACVYIILCKKMRLRTGSSLIEAEEFRYCYDYLNARDSDMLDRLASAGATHVELESFRATGPMLRIWRFR